LPLVRLGKQTEDARDLVRLHASLHKSIDALANAKTLRAT